MHADNQSRHRGRSDLGARALALLAVVWTGPAAWPASPAPDLESAWTRNPVSAERGLPDTFDPASGRHIKWVVPLGTETHATPLVVEGGIFLGTNNNAPRDARHQGDRGVLFCLNEADGALRWRFACDGPLEAALAAAGAMPLPPYIARRRPADAADLTDYQTVYAARDGSVAAPTAGLHFTPGLLARLDAAGVERLTVTLHVGPGTFLPVKAERIADHVMHAEWGEVSAEVAARLNAVRARGGRVIAVGTTALRLLESAAGDDGRIEPFAARTAIFITPGYRFRAVDGLMTNFHLPRSTLFMLVSALMGLERMRAAYAHAIAGGYRFYSYGDASLLLP